MAAISDNVVVRADTSPNQNGGTADQRVCQHYAIGNNGIDCKGHRTGLLTRDEIKQYGIIKNLNEKECLQITSYDLRLGEGHMVYDSADRKWLAKWVSDTPSPKDGNPPYLCEGSNIVIPRFGMALIQLRETIDLLSCIENTVQPVMICGHFDLKLSRVREGLISQQATQVEPGYQGKLFCYLFNQTGDDITLAYADISNSKIVTIEFQYVSCISQCDASIGQQFLKTLKKEHAKYSPPYCNPHGINDVRYFDGAPGELGKLPKHGGLSSIAQGLDDAQENARKGCAEAIKDSGVWRTWVIGLAAIIISLLLFILQQGMREEIVKVWNLITANRGEIAAITTEVNTSRNSLKALRDQAKNAYDMAKKELNELDRQKKALLLKEISNNAKKPIISDENKDKGDNQ